VEEAFQVGDLPRDLRFERAHVDLAGVGPQGGVQLGSAELGLQGQLGDLRPEDVSGGLETPLQGGPVFLRVREADNLRKDRRAVEGQGRQIGAQPKPPRQFAGATEFQQGAVVAVDRRVAGEVPNGFGVQHVAVEQVEDVFDGDGF